MAFYVLKPGTHIEAEQYHSGLEDGFTTWTSDTVNGNPIPLALEEIVGRWIVSTDADSWSATVPYVSTYQYLLPTDYVITPVVGAKTRMRKAEFEAKYELEDSSL